MPADPRQAAPVGGSRPASRRGQQVDKGESADTHSGVKPEIHAGSCTVVFADAIITERVVMALTSCSIDINELVDVKHHVRQMRQRRISAENSCSFLRNWRSARPIPSRWLTAQGDPVQQLHLSRCIGAGLAARHARRGSATAAAQTRC